MTNATLLTRDDFREGVFKRDNHQCVICKAPAQDAHHIIERRLWNDGGYYLDNGASLCGPHHIEAEQTTLSCEAIREKAGITRVILPDHLYEEYQYSKWGDIVNPDGTRIRGELFYDESVQKILRAGGVLPLYTKYVKHPRTQHLPWSGYVTDDDRTIESLEHFHGQDVVVTVKMDGQQITFYNDYMHGRSVDGNHHPSQDFVRNLHARIGWSIPEEMRVCGENLYAKHTIQYENLESYFMVHSIWEGNTCLSWSDTKMWAELLELPIVPVLYEGVYDEALIRKLYQEKYNGDPMEGYVLRVASAFNLGQFRTHIAKYVHNNFERVQNWSRQVIVPNKLVTLK